MADNTDFYEQQSQSNQLSAWDPRLRKNVYTPEGATNYVLNNPNTYKGYDGAVMHVGNTPIHKETFTGLNPVTKDTKGRTKFDPINYRTSREKAAVNGEGRFNPYSSEYNQQQSIWSDNIGWTPGIRPDVVNIRGSGFYNFINGNPIEAKDYGKYGLDPTAIRLSEVAPQRTVADFTKAGKNPYDSVTGRGYSMNAQTPDELALEKRFMAGDHSAGPQLARLRMQRTTANKRSALQRFGSDIFAPALVSGIASMSGPMAPIVGGLGAGVMSKFKNPAAIGLGIVGGYLGGYGVSSIPGLDQLPGAVSGAAVGAGSAAGSSVGRNVATGEWDPATMGRDVALGGASGAATGALPTGPPTSPGGKPTPNPYGPAVNVGARVAGDLAWPRKRSRNPYDYSDR